jgi:cell division protein FtsL
MDIEIARVEFGILYDNVQDITEKIRKNPSKSVSSINVWETMLKKILWLRSLLLDMERKLYAKESESSTLQLTLLKLDKENEELKQKIKELESLL